MPTCTQTSVGRVDAHVCSFSRPRPRTTSETNRVVWRSILHNPRMATRWWFTQDGAIVGYQADDGKWFYKQSGERIGYQEGNWIYAPDGAPIGYFGDGGRAFTPDGQPLGYVQP